MRMWILDKSLAVIEYIHANYQGAGMEPGMRILPKQCVHSLHPKLQLVHEKHERHEKNHMLCQSLIHLS